jgi:hypothetical protein
MIVEISVVPFINNTGKGHAQAYLAVNTFGWDVMRH